MFGLKVNPASIAYFQLVKVVHLLLQVGQKYLEAIGLGGFHVFVSLQRRACCVHDLLCAGGVGRVGVAQSAHVHVRAHLVIVSVVMAAHRRMSPFPAVAALLSRSFRARMLMLRSHCNREQRTRPPLRLPLSSPFARLHSYFFANPSWPEMSRSSID